MSHEVIDGHEEVPNVDAEPEHRAEDPEFVARLRLAIQTIGGHAAAAAATGIKKRTLSRYLQGYEIRRSALISIAKAANVSVEWLAAGFENQAPMGIAVGPVMPLPAPAPEKPAKLFSLINMPLFEAALEGADEALRKAGAAPDNWRARAQLVCLLYDAANADIKNT